MTDLQEIIDDTVGRIRTTYIPHMQADLAKEEFNKLRRRGVTPTSALAVVVYGEAGVGKSATALSWMREFPVKRGTPCDVRPVAYARLTGGRCTYRSVAMELLNAFEDPVPPPSRMNTRELINLVITRIREQKTEFIFLDECELLVSPENHRVNHETAQWIKSVLNDSPCPFGFLGTPPVLDVVSSTDSLERRIDDKIEFSSYDWLKRDHRNEFRSVLATFDTLLAPLEPAGLAEMRMALNLHRATSGKIGYLPRLLGKAAETALLDGARTVQGNHLARAYDRSCHDAAARARNPFRTPDSGKLRGDTGMTTIN